MMHKHLFSTVRFLTLVCGITALAGCGWSSESNVRASAQNATMLSGLSLKNIFSKNIFDFTETVKGPLTIHDAIALGLHHNLESRMADAVSQTAVIPSEFTTLESGIAYVAATRDAGSRKRQAAQTIIREIRSAYLRAASAELLESRLTQALDAAEAASPADQKKRDAVVQDLKTLHNDLSMARAELADLLNISDPATMQLASANEEVLPLSARPEGLELLALSRYPGGASDTENLRDDALNAFPGIRTILTRSTQNAVTEDQWNDFSASFTPGLVRIFSLDLELQQPEHKARLESLQQQALSAAMMTQAHIAYAQYQSAYQDREAAKEELNLHLGSDPVLNNLKNIAAEMQMRRAETGMQIAYGGFLDSIGIDPLPGNADQMSIAKLSDALQKQAEKIAPASFGRAPDQIVAQDFAQDSAAGPVLQKVGFAMPGIPLRIPPAQKISLKKPLKQLPYATVALLNIPDRQIQTLLKAPISEP